MVTTLYRTLFSLLILGSRIYITSLPITRAQQMVFRPAECGVVAVPAQVRDHSETVEVNPGVVVEAVRKGFAAAKAGLREGDVVLTWSRRGAEGAVASPFDLLLLETVHASGFAVALEGSRGSEKKSWRLEPAFSWGMDTRPNFAELSLKVYEQAVQVTKTGKVIEGANILRTAFRSVQAPGGTPTWLPAWLSLRAAQILADSEKWTEADGAFDEAMTRAPLSDHALIAQVLYLWGTSDRDRGDWEAGEKLYVRALDSQRQLAGDQDLVLARMLNSAGYGAYNNGDLAKAEKYYAESLSIKRKLAPESLALAGTLENLGNLVDSLGDYEKTEQYYLEALAIREKVLPESNDVAMILNNLGNLSLDRSRCADAERYYRRAFAIEQKRGASPNSPMFAVLDNGLATVSYIRGDFETARDYFAKCLAIQKGWSPEGDTSVATTLMNIGVVARDQGEPKKAEEYLRQSLKLGQALAPRSLGTALTLMNLGEVRKEQGDLGEAEEYLQQALKITNEQAPNGALNSRALTRLAEVAKSGGDLVKAESYYRRSLAIRQSNAPGTEEEAEILAELGGVLRQSGRTNEAGKLYSQALDVLKGQIAQLGGSGDDRSTFRAGFQDCYKEYVDLLVSMKQVESAFQVLERFHARTLLEMLSSTGVKVRAGVSPALLAEEQRGLDLLRGKMNLRLRLIGGGGPKEEIQALDREIADLLRQNADTQARIRVDCPRYADLEQPQPLSVESIQHMIPDDTLLLEYSLGEVRSYVFIVTTNSLKAYELPGRSEIEHAATRLYGLWTARGRIVEGESEKQRLARVSKADSDSVRASLDLSHLVLGPLAGQLRQRRLLIVSDGALQYVPFAALPEPEGYGPSVPKSAALLIKRHEILNLPSASVLGFLAHSARPRPSEKEIAVFADPVFGTQDPRVKSGQKPTSDLPVSDARSVAPDGAGRETQGGVGDSLARSAIDTNLIHRGDTGLPRLPFTKDEAEAILRVAPQGRAMEVLGFDANRQLATSGELASYRVVHFATHALVNNVHPELSGLVLSLVDQRGNPVDGFLDLEEIYNLGLSADLVVLSGCQTALGKGVSGEGLIGLTRGFMYAGASAVLATLWNANDFATAKLMAHFYKAMEQEGMRPAQALRKAQLDLCGDQPGLAPYYWAGFTLEGDWR